MKITSFSANFDEETFMLLMKSVQSKWPEILTEKRVAEMTNFCLSLAHNEEKPMSFSITHNGESGSFGILAFKDDLGFPNVEFFTFPEMIQTIEEDHERICDKLGI